MQAYDVITVGNALIDAFLKIHDTTHHCRLDEKTGELCFKHGQKINLDTCDFGLGGNASNLAVGLSRLGFKTALCAEIGSDEFATKIINGLMDASVNLSLLKQSPNTPSSFAVGLNYKGDRTLFVEHIIRKHEFNLETSDTKWVYLTSLGDEWKDAYLHVLRYVTGRETYLAFNPGTHQLEAGVDSFRDALKAATVLTVNKEEAQKIVQNTEEGIGILLQRLCEMGPKIVVITDGKNGSYAIDIQKNMFSLGIFDAPIIERTGAGDAYASGFLGGIMHGALVPDAMRWGAVNASGVIQKVGAQAGLLTDAEIVSTLSKHPEFVAKELK